MNHEHAIIKILLDNPEQADVLLTQVDAAKVETESARLILDSAARLLEKGARLNRDAILHFTDLDGDERTYLDEDLPLIDASGGSIENLAVHIREVLGAWGQRQLRLILNDCARTLNNSGDVGKTISQFEAGAKGILTGSNLGHRSLADWVDIHRKYIENLPDDDSIEPYFGVPSLDMIRGHSPGTGELIGIVAGPKVGKSSIFNTMAVNFHLSGRPLVVFSAEMSGLASYVRVLNGLIPASGALVSSKRIFSDPMLKEKYNRAAEGLKTATNIFVDYIDLSIDTVRRSVYFYYHKYGVRDFLFDRLGLFEEVTEDHEFKGRRQITTAMRRLVNEMPEPIRIVLAIEIVNSRLKDSNKRPVPSDIFGGSGIQNNCTQVFLMYRPAHGMPDCHHFEVGPWKDFASRVPGTPYHFMEIYVGLNNNGPENLSALVVLDTEKQLIEEYGQTRGPLVRDLAPEIERIARGENRFSQLAVPKVIEFSKKEDVFVQNGQQNGNDDDILF